MSRRHALCLAAEIVVVIAASTVALRYVVQTAAQALNFVIGVK